MSKVACCKRKLKTKTITEKYKVLKEVEKGQSSASISKKYGVPKQTLSGSLKEKTKIYSEVEKRVRMWLSPHDDLDKAYYMLLLNAQHQGIPVPGTILEVKALYFAKKTWVGLLPSIRWVVRQIEKKNAMFHLK